MTDEPIVRYPPLGGVWALFDRADAHRAELDAAYQAWLVTKPYVWRTDYVAEYDEYIVRLDQAPTVPLAIAAIVKDAVHGFRATLDHLVYRLALIESRQDPPPDADKLAFPISETREAFEQAEKRVRGPLSDLVWGRLEEFQPYRTNPEDKHGSSFWVLQQLDNASKHRELPMTTGALGYRINLAPTGEGVSMHAGPDIGSFRKEFQLLAYRTPDAAIKLDFDVEYVLRFPEREPFPKGYPVALALTNPAERCRGCDRLVRADHPAGQDRRVSLTVTTTGT